MGWDAHTEIEIDYSGRSPKIINPEIRKDFLNAFNWVRKKAGSVDGFLDNGGLDVSTCGKMLSKATGRGVYTNEIWESKSIDANWDFKFDKEDAWAYWSARKFLEVCKKHNIKITFSF